MTIIERLKSQHDGMLPQGEYAFVTKKEIAELMAAVNGITAERDEARREVCSMNEPGLRMNESDKKREAKRRGWDCFKEDGK